jgi:hypothetical protein
MAKTRKRIWGEGVLIAAILLHWYNAVAGWLPEFARKRVFGDLEGSGTNAGGRWARGAKEGLREDGRNEWFERFKRGRKS